MNDTPKFFRNQLGDPPVKIEEAADIGWDLYMSGWSALYMLAVGQETEDDDGYRWERVQ